MASPGIDPARPILSAGATFGDERTRAHGHGPKYHPYSYDEVRPTLAAQVHEIQEELTSLPDSYRGERVIVQAKLHPNYLAASHHPRVLRADADLVMVGTRASRGTLRKRSGPDEENAPTKTLLLAATPDSLARIGELLATTAPPDQIAEEFVRFESIRLPGPERIHGRRREAHDGSDQLAWEAVLHPAIDRRGRASDAAAGDIAEKLHALIVELGGRMSEPYLRQVGTLTFVPVRLGKDQLDELQRFNPLRSIRPMPQMRALPGQSMRTANLAGVTPTPPQQQPPADHRIAAFDGGVDTSHPLLAPYVSETDLTNAPREPECVDHGTLVTSALLYGHMHPGRPLAPPPAYVDHFRVAPAPAGINAVDEPYWILDQILATLRADPSRWSIVNISLGPADSAVDEDDDVNRFTAEIDQLISELGVTVTVAVGNEGRPILSTLGEDRVMAPADAVNVLAVGACDDLTPEQPTRATYSCVGPGRPGLRVAPLGVSFGGSSGQRFIGAAGGGGFQMNAGTSFAAPASAHGLATLLAAVPFSANLARGMAAHFALAPAQRDLLAVGYGRLRDDYTPLLECPPGTVSVVVQDTLERGMTRAYPLPFPVGGVNSRVKARWTVSFISSTDPQDAVEYTQAGLEVVLRPNATAYTMSLKNSGEKAIDVDLRTDGSVIQNLAAKGWLLSVNPKTRSGKAIRSEHTLRDEGKWETVMRHEDGANAGTFHLPSIWVTYYERTEGELTPTGEGTDLDFTLLMTVEASKSTDLYEQVRADSRFSILAPLTVPVRVRV
jgi:hypothetical protein